MTHRDDDSESHVGHAHAPGVDCRGLARMLGDYVDGQLPTEVKTQVDAHMSMCAPCMAFIKQYKFAPEAARQVLLKAVPVELEDRVLSFLRKKCKPE